MISDVDSQERRGPFGQRAVHVPCHSRLDQDAGPRRARRFCRRRAAGLAIPLPVHGVGGRGLLLEDLDSTNGTFVNDKRAERVTLTQGDRVRVGRVELAVETRLKADEAEGTNALSSQERIRPPLRPDRRARPCPEWTGVSSGNVNSTPLNGPDQRRRSRLPADRFGRSIPQTACRRRTTRTGRRHRPTAGRRRPASGPACPCTSIDRSPTVNVCPAS